MFQAPHDLLQLKVRRSVKTFSNSAHVPERSETFHLPIKLKVHVISANNATVRVCTSSGQNHKFEAISIFIVRRLVSRSPAWSQHRGRFPCFWQSSTELPNLQQFLNSWLLLWLIDSTHDCTSDENQHQLGNHNCRYDNSDEQWVFSNNWHNSIVAALQIKGHISALVYFILHLTYVTRKMLLEDEIGKEQNHCS